jgi:hypothetical protein
LAQEVRDEIRLLSDQQVGGAPNVDEYSYALSPRLVPLKAILAKLWPPQPPSGSSPPLEGRDAPSAAGRRRRRG